MLMVSESSASISECLAPERGRLISLTHNPLSHILQIGLSSFEIITKQGIGGSIGISPRDH